MVVVAARKTPNIFDSEYILQGEPAGLLIGDVYTY